MQPVPNNITRPFEAPVQLYEHYCQARHIFLRTPEFEIWKRYAASTISDVPNDSDIPPICIAV